MNREDYINPKKMKEFSVFIRIGNLGMVEKAVVKAGTVESAIRKGKRLIAKAEDYNVSDLTAIEAVMMGLWEDRSMPRLNSQSRVRTAYREQ